jgi:hypothetical protein
LNPASKDEAEPMEEVEEPAKPAIEREAEREVPPRSEKPKIQLPAATKEPKSEAPASADGNVMDIDAAEDFVIVEGGGEGDELAQEKATNKQREDKENEKEVQKGKEPDAGPEKEKAKVSTSAGAQPPNDVESSVPKPALAQSKGNGGYIAD